MHAVVVDKIGPVMAYGRLSGGSFVILKVDALNVNGTLPEAADDPAADDPAAARRLLAPIRTVVPSPATVSTAADPLTGRITPTAVSLAEAVPPISSAGSTTGSTWATGAPPGGGAAPGPVPLPPVPAASSGDVSAWARVATTGTGRTAAATSRRRRDQRDIMLLLRASPLTDAPRKPSDGSPRPWRVRPLALRSYGNVTAEAGREWVGACDEARRDGVVDSCQGAAGAAGVRCAP